MTWLELFASARVGADVAMAVLVKGTLVLALAGLTAHVCARRSAAARHMLWTAAIVAVGILPWVEVFGPDWTHLPTPIAHYPAEVAWVGLESIAVTAPEPAEVPLSPNREVATPRRGDIVPPATTLFLITWWAGVLALGVRLVGDRIRVHALRRRSRPLARSSLATELLEQERRRMGIRRPVAIGRVDEPGFAATLGCVRPLIVLGPDVTRLSEDALRSVLVHELAHVRRYDALTHLLASGFAALAWPNPLTWVARAQQVQAREQACDDRVLGHGIFPSEYAAVLLTFATTAPSQSPIAGASVGLRFCATRRRLDAILEPGSRAPFRPRFAATLTVLLLGGSVAIGTIDALASPPGTGASSELIAGLSHPDARVRRRAALTLGRRDPVAARVQLEERLDDECEEVRLAAAGALARLADPASTTTLARVLERPFDGGHGENGFVLKLAMLTLADIGTTEAADVLVRQLDRSTDQLRWLALQKLSQMEGQTARARILLEEMSVIDSSARNRSLAAAQLRQLQPAG